MKNTKGQFLVKQKPESIEDFVHLMIYAGVELDDVEELEFVGYIWQEIEVCNLLADKDYDGVIDKLEGFYPGSAESVRTYLRNVAECNEIGVNEVLQMDRYDVIYTTAACDEVVLSWLPAVIDNTAAEFLERYTDGLVWNTLTREYDYHADRH